MYNNGIIKKYVEEFNQNDEETKRQAISNDKAFEWLCSQIPLFECADKLIEKIYYFRWWVFRKHIKNIPDGQIITEFLSDVPWSGPYNSINCACGHHLAEARWLRDGKKLAESYIRFWMEGRGDIFAYSCWIAQSIYQYSVLRDRKKFAVGYKNQLDKYYQHIENTNMTRYGLFWSHDDRDAMELSISGDGLRPTLNSYMYANAKAISKIASWANDVVMEKNYAAKAEELKKKINCLLWDSKENFYKVIPQAKKNEEIASFDFSNITSENNVKEEIGFIPWAYGIPPEEYNGAWKYLMSNKHFWACYGPRTADLQHPRYGFPYHHECLWNGPSWPFATTQTLNSMITLLQGNKPVPINRLDFLKQMRIYANSHYRTTEEGKRINWIDEDLDPDTGEWLSRDILKKEGWPKKMGGRERGKDYNHSAFCDLVIRGLCGVEIRDSPVLYIDPLIPQNGWDYFMVDRLPYQNHILRIQYDKDGSHYGSEGFRVFVDGELAVYSNALKKVEIKI